MIFEIMKKEDINNELLIKGYLDAETAPGLNLREEIGRLKQEKNAVILAHYYQQFFIYRFLPDRQANALDLLFSVGPTAKDSWPCEVFFL